MRLFYLCITLSLASYASGLSISAPSSSLALRPCVSNFKDSHFRQVEAVQNAALALRGGGTARIISPSGWLNVAAWFMTILSPLGLLAVAAGQNDMVNKVYPGYDIAANNDRKLVYIATQSFGTYIGLILMIIKDKVSDDVKDDLIKAGVLSIDAVFILSGLAYPTQADGWLKHYTTAMGAAWGVTGALALIDKP